MDAVLTVMSELFAGAACRPVRAESPRLQSVSGTVAVNGPSGEALLTRQAAPELGI